MNGKLNILLVEDNPGDARLIREALISARGTPFHLQVMDRLALGLECLAAGGIDLLLLDLSLPDCQGLETFTAAHTQAPGVPIIVLTGLDDETVAMAAMREGAQDYLVKGQADGDLLARSIHYAIERKRTEKALRDSETRYRRLFEAARDGILLLDAATGQITDVNPFMVELLGYSHQEYLGKRLWEIGLFKDIVASQAAFDELQREGYVRYEDLPLETKDGRPMSVEFVSNVYLVDSTRVIQCNIRDITERKQAEESLKASEARFATIFRANPAAIAFTRISDNHLIDVNQAWQDLTGYSRGEAVGHTQSELNLWPHPEQRARLIETVRTQGRARGEVQLARKSGEVCDLLMSAELVELAGEPYLLTMAQDITERKQAEAKIKEQLAELERWYNVMLDREDRVLQLKHEVNELLCRLGEPIRYPSVEDSKGLQI
jgi:PAS domain S-box-containing protein